METRQHNVEELPEDYDGIFDESDAEEDDGRLPVPENIDIYRTPVLLPTLGPEATELPKVNKQTLTLAAYFTKFLNRNTPIADVLSRIAADGLEPTRTPLNTIINAWSIFARWPRPDNEDPKYPETWLGLDCIGIPKYAISSYSRLVSLENRRLRTPWENGIIPVATVEFADGKSRNVSIYNLTVAAFHRFPTKPHMTVDHHDRDPWNGVLTNLSFETKSFQSLNQRKSKSRMSQKIAQIDPAGIKKTVIWQSTKIAADTLDLPLRGLQLALLSDKVYMNFLWEYHVEPIQGERFVPIPIPGLGTRKISNKGRLMYANGHVTFGHRARNEYHSVVLKDDRGISRSYGIHYLVALAFKPNPNGWTIVNHIDRKRWNNDEDNLQWVTQAMNVSHAYEGEHARMTPVMFYVWGEYQRTYTHITLAADETGITRHEIRNMCMNTLNEDAPMWFQFLDDTYNPHDGGSSGLPIAQLDASTGEVLFVWASRSQAKYYTGIGGHFHTAVNTDKTRGGYKWRDLHIHEAPLNPRDIPNFVQLLPRLVRKNSVRRRGPFVLIVKDGRGISRKAGEYKSVLDLMKTLNIDRDTANLLVDGQLTRIAALGWLIPYVFKKKIYTAMERTGHIVYPY